MKHKIPLFQVDAFTGTLFGGNPAAVCPMRVWPDDDVLQKIAAENNLSETAFIVGGQGKYRIRWFTPVAEVDLCGHATLASAFVVLRFIDPSLKGVKFLSKSGVLGVSRAGDLLAMDFPVVPAEPVEAPPALLRALRKKPREVLAADRDYLVVYDDEAAVRALRPDMAKLEKVDRLGVIATAPGRDSDFVSRFFAPRLGVPEDPVTGSAHCTLVPYWAKRLQKDRLHARQVSARGGEILCMARGKRVYLAGKAVLYLRGAIEV